MKIANIRAWRKLLWPFLRSLKGFQLLPPCEVEFFPFFFFYIFWMKFVDYILVTIKENVLITWNCDLILFYLLRLASKSSLSWCQELSRRPIERKTAWNSGFDSCYWLIVRQKFCTCGFIESVSFIHYTQFHSLMLKLLGSIESKVSILVFVWAFWGSKQPKIEKKDAANIIVESCANSYKSLLEYNLVDSLWSTYRQYMLHVISCIAFNFLISLIISYYCINFLSQNI